MAIPVNNLYYLLSYAWGYFRPGTLIDLESRDLTEQVDLFATVLVTGTNRLFRRGLDKGYRTYEQELSGVRGQVNFDASLKRMLFNQGKAQCRVDEFTPDVLHNRLLKTTMQHLCSVPELDSGLRAQVRRAVREFRGVGEVPHLRPGLFRRVRLHRNNQHYRFLLNVCQLIVENLLIHEASGETRFRDILRDETTMSTVFESFVRAFYHKEHPTFRSGRDTLRWGATADDPEHLRHLPKMYTDITLRSANRVIIIDTKYYSKTLQGRSATGGTVHSGNLYQLYAYLRSFELSFARGRRVEGMLLYPVVNRELRLDYEIDGFRVQICTVDLAKSWRHIEKTLLELVAEVDPSPTKSCPHSRPGAL